MFKSLYWKLTLAFVLVAFITAALVGVFIRATSATRLMQFIIDQQRSHMQETLAEYYASHGSWDQVEQNWWEMQLQSSPTAAVQVIPGPPVEGNPTFVRGERRSLLGLADARGVVIVQVDPKYPAGTLLPANYLYNATFIEVDGARVGTILTADRLPNFNPEEALFLQRTNRALMLGISAALVVALIIGVVLARTLTNPLKALTRAAQGIAEGQLEQQVNVRTQDEIGQFARAFNRMSQEVARGNNMRKQMTADIAHDLRTPLTVIGGYVESMRDGVLQPTTQRFSIIYTEIERLQKLVGDLRILSQADAGELPLYPERISPATLIERAIRLFQHQAEQQDIRLSMDAQPDLPEVCVDANRMMQVMDNLLSNAFRYTPPGGEIRIRARAEDRQVQIIVQDTGTGIDSEDLPYIFERFHRSDKSRHAEAGESGLGLAIVKALVESQGGKVWAVSTPGDGTAINIQLPAAEGC